MVAHTDRIRTCDLVISIEVTEHYTTTHNRRDRNNHGGFELSREVGLHFTMSLFQNPNPLQPKLQPLGEL